MIPPPNASSKCCSVSVNLIGEILYIFSDLIKYAGAAYLVFLGIQALLKKSENASAQHSVTKERSVPVRQAILIEVLNPKTTIFFLAFLPQFVQPDKGSIVLQLSILGFTFVMLSIVYTTLLSIVNAFFEITVFSLVGNINLLERFASV